jgi:hypothetical protein
MAQKNNTAAPATVVRPEPTARIITRTLEFNQDALDRLNAALGKKKPLKIAVNVGSKVFVPVFSGRGKLEGEIIIEDPTVEPPDSGEEIPEEEGPEFEIPLPPGSGGRKVTSATIELYAVAVFRPQFKKATARARRR